MEKQAVVQSLDRAFALIELLSQRPAGMLLSELADATGLHKSTAHRLLASLMALGYVKKEEASHRYSLTLRLFELSGRVVDSMDILQAARGPLERLRNATEEAVHLVTREGNDIVYIHKAESHHGSIRMFSRIGMRRPLYCTGVGKSILAHLPDHRVEKIWRDSDIRPYTPHTIVEQSELFSELERIRAQGYALDNEENELGVRCIAAAVLDYTGACRNAISLSAPVVRMSDSRIRTLIPRILETAAEISAELGYTPGAGARRGLL